MSAGRPYLLESCESTNTWLKERPDLKHGDWVRSERQTQGRGRKANPWIGLDGNLFFSIALELRDSTPVTWVPLMTAASVRAEILERHPLPIQLKWPNDLVIDSKKLCGILCESVSTRDQRIVICGVGLNVKESPGTLEKEKRALTSTSLREAGVTDVELDPLAEALAARLLSDYGRLVERGPGWVSELYDRHGYFTRGDRMQWIEDGGAREGEYLGLGAFGEAKVDGGSGPFTLLNADWISKARKR